jgi:hypothetical protein
LPLLSVSGQGHGAPESLSRTAKTRLLGVIEPVARRSFETSPVLTYVAGWDFAKEYWRLNEFTNQWVHMHIGQTTSRLMGKPFTFCLAVGIEAQQFFFNDECEPKWLDRLRDVAFYLLPPTYAN